MREVNWSLVDELAAELGVKERARLKWRQRRVPYRLRHQIIDLAKRKQIRGVTYEALDSLGQQAA